MEEGRKGTAGEGIPSPHQPPELNRPAPTRQGSHCSCGGWIDEADVCARCTYDFRLGCYHDHRW